MNRARTCRPWYTYQGQPRRYQPWCECGWRSPDWLHPAEAQKQTDRHLAYAANHRRKP